ncbi:MAG: hypothetical protein LBQ12_01175, partial [Deltaproteobacteria bacterium]|nr:hypothetical protein [Deltaproteobacteria bacterium]
MIADAPPSATFPQPCAAFGPSRKKRHRRNVQAFPYRDFYSAHDKGALPGAFLADGGEGGMSGAPSVGVEKGPTQDHYLRYAVVLYPGL